MNSNNKKILEELDALIEQAWGKGHEGCAIKHDPALGRTLEWIKESFEDLMARVPRCEAFIPNGAKYCHLCGQSRDNTIYYNLSIES